MGEGGSWGEGWGWHTFRHLRHTAGLQPEGGLPFLGSPSAAVLLVLGAAELALPLRLLAAVRAQADHTLLPHQKLAPVPIAHHNHLLCRIQSLQLDAVWCCRNTAGDATGL